MNSLFLKIIMTKSGLPQECKIGLMLRNNLFTVLIHQKGKAMFYLSRHRKSIWHPFLIWFLSRNWREFPQFDKGDLENLQIITFLMVKEKCLFHKNQNKNKIKRLTLTTYVQHFTSSFKQCNKEKIIKTSRLERKK